MTYGELKQNMIKDFEQCENLEEVNGMYNLYIGLLDTIKKTAIDIFQESKGE